MDTSEVELPNDNVNEQGNKVGFVNQQFRHIY